MSTLVMQGTSVRASISRPQTRLGALAAFVGLFVADQVRMRMKVRRDRHHLQALSDHMLADLGLRRSDIE